MRCPECRHTEDKVIDSRLSKDGNVIRRRRVCSNCDKRFTTYEKIEESLPLIIKKDCRRESFDRIKIIAGIKKACEKRPVSINLIEGFVDKLEQWTQDSGEKEIKSSDIGEKTMEWLHGLDEVAYVRFASVYRQFKDIDEFMIELKDLHEAKREKDKETSLE